MTTLKKYINKKSTPVKVVLVILIFVFGFFAGGFTQAKIQESENQVVKDLLGAYTPPEDLDLTPLWKAWHMIETKYVPVPKSATSTEATKEPEPKEKLWGMIKGLAESLGDPYTTFLPPEEKKMFMEDMSGSFEGVGMEVTYKNGNVVVVAPLKDTPAYKAGMKAGDIILEVDGQSTEGLGLDAVVRMIRGPKGTPVVLTVARQGEPEPIKIKIIRGVIKIPTVKTKALPENDAYVIELLHFNQNADMDFKRALMEFIESGYKNLIIDLRGNPGGYLDTAVEIASLFLPEGAVVVQEYYGDKPDDKPPVFHRSRGYNALSDDKKIIILVNKGSASASEILAGALKAHGKAVLIGENTFGKGSIQELIPITKDTSLKVTTARWILPDGTYINSTGIKPDIEVELTDEDKKILETNPEHDPILNTALQYLSTE